MKDILSLDFLKQNDRMRSDHHVYVLYYVLKGNAVVESFHETFHMHPYDIILFNPKESCSLKTTGALVARIRIESNTLSYLINRKHKYFICNTAKEENENFTVLRHLLDKLINTLFEEDYQKMLFQKYSYDVISFLLMNFSNNTLVDYAYDRKEEIQSYIELNYQNDISLEMLSDHFGLTPPYFSKYFKNAFHMTFLKYLNDVRVQNACEQLLQYDDTIIKIALENGFPNLASFTRVFYAHYGMNPGQYRLQHKQKIKEEPLSYEEVKECLQHLNTEIEKQQHIVKINMNEVKGNLTPYWFELFNVGKLSMIVKDGMKEQIRELQKELGFLYARVFLDLEPIEKRNTYFKEENVFDFLFEIKMKLYLVIDYRLYSENVHFLPYLKDLIYHFINRYGLNHILNWQFELFYDSDFSQSKSQEYQAFYNKISRLFDEIGLHNKLCGPGILLDEGGENLKRFLKVNTQLEALTISVAPYTIRNKEDGNIFINRTTDTNYVIEQYRLAKSIATACSSVTRVQIVSWKDSLNEINVLNDTSYRASRILQTTLKGYLELETLAIDTPLDLMFDNVVDNTILSGLPGLISKKGVRKPAFFAYKFLKKLDQRFLFKDGNVLATCSDKKYIQIVCHNCKKLNYRYYNEEAEKLKQYHIEDYFEDMEELKMSFYFQNLIDGKYIMKYRTISEEDGSAFSKWQDMKFEHSSFFGIDEMEYLTSVSKPSIKGLVLKVNNGIMKFQITVKANEIKHIHLIYLH